MTMIKPDPSDFHKIRGNTGGLFGNRFMLSMLKRTPFFYDLTDREFLGISQQIVLHQLEPDTTVILEKERRDSIFFVSEGSLKGTIFSPETGESVLLSQFSKGSFFGEVSLLTGRLNPISITTLSPCELLEIPGSVYKKIAFRYPSARGFLIGLYKQHSCRVEETLKRNRVNRRRLNRTPFEGGIVFQQFEPGSKEKIIKVGTGTLIDISETGVAFYLDRRQVSCRLDEMVNREYRAKISIPDSFSLKVLGKVVGFEFSVTGKKFYDLYIARMAITRIDRNDRASLQKLLEQKNQETLSC